MDRRLNPRYRPLDDSLEIFTHDQRLSGWIVDLGRGGVSFEYLPGSIEPLDVQRVDIISGPLGGVFLPGVPCRKVYDIRVEEDNPDYSQVSFRRCGLKYRELSEKQRRKYEQLLAAVGAKAPAQM
jgi:hypothetical protein